MLIHTLVACAVALIVSFGATPFVRRFAWKVGAVDAPGGRRVHLDATPRLGGLAVLLGYLTALGAVFVVSSGAFPEQPEPLVGFILGGVFLAAVGAWDDVRALGAKKKLLAQVIAISIAFAGGARIVQFELPWFGELEFGLATSYLLSLVWSLAFINAINLIDGLDGLAGGIVVFACITNTVVGFATGNELAVVLNAALGGAVLAFLYFNFNPATIFLGDAGSMFLGYALATPALMSGRQKESTLVAFLVPLIALGVPLTDTLFTMLRRFLARRPIFSPDRGHIHHRLLDLGLTHRRVVMSLYLATVLMCVVALLAAFGKDWVVGGALFAAAVIVIGGARFAGYFQHHILARDASLVPQVEFLRWRLPRLLRELDDASPEKRLQRLGPLILGPGDFMGATLVDSLGELAWAWERPTESTPSGKPATYEYRLQDGAVMTFVCDSERGVPSAKLDALLQLVADAATCQRAPETVGCRATLPDASGHVSVLTD